MRRVLLAAACALALVTACSDGDDPAVAPSPTPTPSPTPVQPFDTITPPVSPGVGTYPAVTANRAYRATQGFLALQLFEKPTLLGRNDPELVSQLAGTLKDTTVADALGTPKRVGLDYRPRFATGTALSEPVASVTRSVYTADEVQGRGGESALRVHWEGTVVYPVTVRGAASSVTYSLGISYIFAPVPGEPGGLALAATVQGSPTFEGVVTACVAKGLLYPGPAAGRCPV